MTQTWWEQLTTPAAAAPAVVVVTALAAALAVVLPRRTWPVVRHAVTLVHEGGHALVALLAGRRLHGVRLHADSSGLTLSRGPRRGFGAVLTLASGYPAPAVLGLACAAVLSRGYVLAVLAGLVVALALLLLQVRNWFGLWSVLVVGAVLVAAAWYLPDVWQQGFVLAVTWFLLVAAVRPVLELQASRRRGRGGASDADQLAAMTRVPGAVWTVVFALVCLGCAAAGAWLLGAEAVASLA